MREGGKILGQCLAQTAAKALPGVSTLELDQFAEEFLRRHGTFPSFKGYHGFPATLCTNINEQVVHGIPSKTQILQEGDIIAIDCGCLYKDLHTDATVFIAVGPANGRPATDQPPANPEALSPEKARLLSSAKEILDTALNAIHDGIYLNDLCDTIGKAITTRGYSVVTELTGHGIGYRLHEPPHIPNQKEGTSGGPILKAGMTLAIEPIFTTGSGKIITLSDNWTIVTADKSLAAQIEHTILVTETGCEILTNP